MRRLPMAALCLLMAGGCAQLGIPPVEVGRADARQVTVEGREWSVARIGETPPIYRARHVPEGFQLFFGPPAVPKSVQALRAIEAVSGCGIVQDSVRTNVSAEFFAQVDCPAGPAG